MSEDRDYRAITEVLRFDTPSNACYNKVYRILQKAIWNASNEVKLLKALKTATGAEPQAKPLHGRDTQTTRWTCARLRADDGSFYPSGHRVWRAGSPSARP